MREDKNTVENNIMNIVEPVKADTDAVEKVEESGLITMTEEEYSELAEALIEKGKTEQVPLEPMILDPETIKTITQTEEFLKGVDNVSELLGELTAVATFGVTPHMWIQHKEQLQAMEMNMKIAKMNADISKDIKKKIVHSNL